MKQRKNLEQIKNMISKNKKIVIAIILIIILSLVIGIAFASKPSDNKKTESQTEQKIDVSEENNNKEEEDKKEENENSKTDKNTDNSNSTSTTKDNNNSSTDSNKKDTSSSNSGNSGNSGSDKPSQPAHQHSWKQHTAQKWVSNMVTVPDYETQKVPVGNRYIFFYDGYTTDNINDAKAHAKELILAGVDDGYRTETIYETKQVQVGSHQEDHGHNETYVDYEYCDCGARR
ncbi:hypothetical protein [Longibaculum muris]|nr:hypothetical protein [Longibaculum muris]MCR1888779.1 hypothetical protein [Longibaculum muris]